jgi:hypothetical protein
MSQLCKADWKSALDVQDASNLSGVLHSLTDMSEAIWNDVRDPNSPSNDFNTHPIVRLYVYKLFHLAFTEPLGEASCDRINSMFDEAYIKTKEITDDHGKA